MGCVSSRAATSTTMLATVCHAAAADLVAAALCRVPGLFAFLRRRYPQILSPVEKCKGEGGGQQQQPVDNLYIGEATPLTTTHCMQTAAATAAAELVPPCRAGIKTDE